MIGYEVDAEGVATVSWDLPGRPVNILSMESRLLFVDYIGKALADPAVKGILITSAKKEFIAGADLTLLQTFRGQPADEIIQRMRPMRDMLRKMETAGKPVVAAMNGTALGGGLEICLACHRRIAADRPDAVFGLPEVGLGLLPGAGGTQRLPRMIGIKAALPLLLEGTRFSARKAHELGIIDELVPADRLIERARAWLLSNPSPVQPWDRDAPVPGGAATSPDNHRLFVAQSAKTHDETRGNFPAPPAILSCVFEGMRVPMDVGLDIEFRYFASLVRGDVAQNTIRTFFFSVNEARKLSMRPAAPTLNLTKLGILGAGTMGLGVAQVAAEGGLDVVLLDRDEDSARNSVTRLAADLGKLVDKGRMSAETRDAVLARIKPTADFNDLAGCQAVIEAVFEDRAIKDDVTRRTLAVTGSDILFGSNTSKIPITGLAASSDRPDRFIGLHFFSPVPRMALIEIIRGKETSDETLAHALDLAKALGRTPIVVNDGPGFFTSRCVSSYLNEGVALLREGVPAAMIENAGKLAGMPVGPLTLGDEIGLDVMYKVRTQEAADKGEAWQPGPEFDVVKHMVANLGRFGRKGGAGFYEYPPGEGKQLWPELSKLYPPSGTLPSLDYLKTRLLTVQALEAARCFHEGVIDDPHQADVGSVLGWSFAKYTGGVCSYIDTVGVARFLAQCDALAAEVGPRFNAPDTLRAMAQEGRGFYG